MAERACIERARVARQKRQRDRTVDLKEDPDRARPEALELAAQLVGQRDASVHEILASARQRAQRLGVITVGLQAPEAVMIGPRELAQHERVKAIGLAARDLKTRPRRLDLVRMQREHAQPRVEQPLDQHAIRTLDRDPRHFQTHQRRAQPPEPRLAVLKARRQQRLAELVGDQHIVLGRRPIHTRAIHPDLPTTTPLDSGPDPEVPWRVLIDGPHTGATSCRRWRHLTPPGGAGLA